MSESLPPKWVVQSTTPSGKRVETVALAHDAETAMKTIRLKYPSWTVHKAEPHEHWLYRKR